MGIASKSADLEAYNNNSYIGTKSSTNLNLFGISESEPSHMMVHDDMKTYAVLSGRCDEDMSSHVQSNSTISPQQQTQFQQARQSYSIINYAGPHGQSPNIRAVDLSASPPVRGHRIPISTSPEALIGHQSQNKSYPNINVAHSQHQPNPSLNHQIQQETFQRAFESSNLFEIPDQRHLHTLPLLHHPATPNYGHVHITQQQQQQQQATSQYLLKHEHRREYYDNVSPHPGLTMARYSGSMPQHSGGYMKPPPVDLDELSDEERERMRVKRERNRVAAAKCRNRRRELLERLEKEAEQLEREQELLRENVRRLRVQKLQLGNMLEEHEPTCHKVLTKESDKKSLDTEGDKEEEGKEQSDTDTSRITKSSPQQGTSQP